MPKPALKHPDVKVAGQFLLDHALRGTPVPPVAAGIGGGSTNMHLLVAAQNHAADPAKYRQALLDILDGMERDGLFTIAGTCEQGTAAPHVELSLLALSSAYLYAVVHDSELAAKLNGFFTGLYAYGLALSTPKGWVIGPGPRMLVYGPHSVVLDADVGIIGGRVKRFPFGGKAGTVARDTGSAWCLLEVLRLAPKAFDEARSITLANVAQHLPALRLALTIERHENGHRASLEVKPEDAGIMGPIGSGGIGCDRAWVSYGPKPLLGWKAYGSDGAWRGEAPVFDVGAQVQVIQRSV